MWARRALGRGESGEEVLFALPDLGVSPRPCVRPVPKDLKRLSPWAQSAEASAKPGNAEPERG